VLPNHASRIASLVAGQSVYRLPSGEEHSVATEGGLVDVNRDVISVCIY
ncbi:MAG: hypothetical protein K2M09_09125, partial [Muribaculaceae bacterium]|nr:hypothetical protein [Muribaculaceae bacterium]